MEESKVMFIIDKAFKVISSCETLEQLGMAERYAGLAIAELNSIANPACVVDLNVSLRLKRQRLLKGVQ